MTFPCVPVQEKYGKDSKLIEEEESSGSEEDEDAIVSKHFSY